MYLSKTKYCDAIQCNKMLWLETNKPTMAEVINNQSVLDNGTKVGELARSLFGKHVTIEFDNNLDVMIENTIIALKKMNTVVCEASFDYQNNFCSVDILKKVGNTYEIYEVKSSTEVSDIYLDDISYQYYVLNGLNYNVSKAFIVHLNSGYFRHGELELNKLFVTHDVTDIVLEKQSEVDSKIKEINEYMKQDEENKKLGLYCFKPYDCPFFKYCSKNLPENNVFNIRNMQNKKKIDLYNDGIISYEELLNTDIDKKYKQQIEYELNNLEDYINKDKIKEFLGTLSYPLYFLDFETFQMAIPLYDNISPYMQVPFQYSLHYYEDKNILKHKEFLSKEDIDPRRLLAESLIHDIPKDVCVLAYNMSFEKNVIKNLALLYPDLRDNLMNIHDNIKDLMIPFKNRDYYTKDMHGSYSIKYVLPSLYPNDPSLDYHNLDDVHNGSEAMSSFANMGKLSKEEKEKLRHNLLKYCELDTYAMVKIFDKLNEVV